VQFAETVAEIARGIAVGDTSAEETARECLERIERADPRVCAFVSVDGDLALSRARKIDAARAAGETLGLLGGVPIGIKDNICTRDGHTTCGSKMLGSFTAKYNARVVDLLEAAGAVIIGKTNLDEFAMGSSTEHSISGCTRNPWDATRVAGGSSGGSAAAVAAGMVPAALGSDTGGSVRQPASFCGVVGLKPSYGRVSRYGLVAFGSSLDQIGPIANDVRDVAMLLAIIAGHDPHDSTSVVAPVPDYVTALDQPVRGLRIGVSSEYFGEGLDSTVADAVQAAVAELEGQGAQTVPIELPHMKYAIACYYIIAPAEASSNLARFDGVHYGRRAADPDDILDLYESSRSQGFGTEVKRRIMLGTYALSTGYYDEYYLKALKVRTLIKQDFDRAFDQVDVIVSPVAPTTAFRIGEKIDDPLTMYLSDIYTISANLAGICAISLPCGFDPNGLPIGLQLMGPAFGEQRLLQVAHQYKLQSDFRARIPPTPQAGA